MEIPSKPLRIAISTLGCKTNQFESSTIAQQFQSLGFEIVDFTQTADVYLINTCTVTNRTDFKSRNLIRKALAVKARNPYVKIIVTGCYAQRSREEVLALGDVDYIVDNQAKVNVLEWLDNDNYCFCETDKFIEFKNFHTTSMLDRTRAFLKIQDGCDYRCNYCAVPYARGNSRSNTISNIVQQANALAQNGYKEIVLGGINLGLYSDGTNDLSNVLIALESINGIELLRLSSIEPQLWTNRLLQQLKTSDKICPHFHIPLQSGCDSVLQRMGRHYQTKDIKHLLDNIYSFCPDAAIGFDVICGYPEESDDEFKQTYRFLDNLPISYLHVFTYSPRKGTPAAIIKNQIDGKLKNIRTNTLTDLSSLKKNAYGEKLISAKTVLRGVIESNDQGIATALSDHYLRVYTKAEVSINTFCHFEGLNVSYGDLEAKLIASDS